MAAAKKRVRNKSTGRNYKKEYANYQGKKGQIKRRSSRNKARRKLGIYGKGGGDVAHSDDNPLNNKRKNLKVQKPSKNRSFKRTKTAGMAKKRKIVRKRKG